MSQLTKMPSQDESSDKRGGDGRPANVWLYQLVVHHYRLPVWDRIFDLGGDDYRFTVRGPLKDEQLPAASDRPVSRRDFVAESAVRIGNGDRRRTYLRNNHSDFYKRLGIQLARWPAAADEITRERPDVVIVTGNMRNSSSWRLPLLCRKLGIGTAQWSKVHAHSYSTTPTYLTRPLRRRFFSRFDSHIVYGRESRAELMQLGVSSDIIHIAQNTIDTDFIFQSPDKIAARAGQLKQEAGIADRRAVVSVGSMVPIKRQLELVEAWPRISAGHDDLVLVLVGGGPMLEAVRGRAAEVDAGRIVVTGRVGEGDDHCWLAAADVAVVPGGAGLSINASMALGKPTVIGDEFGADAEIVTHGVTGWRYPLGDLEAMVKSVRLVLTGGNDVRKVVENARRLMRDEVTIDNMARGADAAIRQALAVGRERKRGG